MSRCTRFASSITPSASDLTREHAVCAHNFATASQHEGHVPAEASIEPPVLHNTTLYNSSHKHKPSHKTFVRSAIRTRVPRGDPGRIFPLQARFREARAVGSSDVVGWSTEAGSPLVTLGDPGHDAVVLDVVLIVGLDIGSDAVEGPLERFLRGRVHHTRVLRRGVRNP